MNYDDFNHHHLGNVTIGNDVFIGMKVVVVRPIDIGAGSIVNKNIPTYTIWGGNPARLIKKREITIIQE